MQDKVKTIPHKKPSLLEDIRASVVIDDLELKSNTIAAVWFYEGSDIDGECEIDIDTYAAWLQSKGKLTGVYDTTDAAGEHVQQVTQNTFTEYWYNADLKEKYQDMKEYLMKPPVIVATDKTTIVHQLQQLAKTA